MKAIKYYTICLISSLLSSCYEDKGNYDYNDSIQDIKVELDALYGIKKSDEIMKYKKHLHSITNSISASTELAQKYDYLNIPLKSNNFIFLASDGFYNFCQLNNLFDIISDDTNKEVITDELVSNAITNGSNDNISFSYFGLLKEN